jgi:predicted PurR-regulated permease PerM
MMTERRILRMDLRTWLALLSLGVALMLVSSQAALLVEIFWVLFGSLLLSLSIRPLAHALAQRRVPRAVTVIGVFIASGLVLALVGSLLVPTISTEIGNLQTSGPDLIRQAMDKLSSTPLLGQLVPSTDVLIQDITQRMDAVLGTAISTAAGIGGLALDLLVMLILTFFLATDEDLPERTMVRWMPDAYEVNIRSLWARLEARLSRWVWAQAGIATYFAVIFSIGLTLLNVPFALTIGLLGGVLEIVPYLGGFVSLLLAMVSALSVEPILALWVFVFYTIVVEIEAHVVAPAFYGRIMGLHPAAALVALLIGAKAAGVVGALFAVPLTVVLVAILQETRGEKAQNRDPDRAGEGPPTESSGEAQGNGR